MTSVAGRTIYACIRRGVDLQRKGRMGGAAKNSPDVSKGAPRDPFAVDEDFDVADEYSYCQTKHVLGVRLASGVAPIAGSQARLVFARPPQVFADGETIGEVTAEFADAMAGCIEAGYRMVGWLEAVDLDARSGVLVVRGEPPA